MGARVGQKDLFIHIDHFEDATHSHAAPAAASQLVYDSFLAQGIILHIDAGPNCIMIYPSTTWGALSPAQGWTETISNQDLGTGSYDWSALNTYKTRANGFMSTGCAPVLRYCLAVHNLSSAETALGVIGATRVDGKIFFTTGSDFTICWGAQTPTDVQWAVNFMHELGHCLSLKHTGDQVEVYN